MKFLDGTYSYIFIKSLYSLVKKSGVKELYEAVKKSDIIIIVADPGVNLFNHNANPHSGRSNKIRA